MKNNIDKRFLVNSNYFYFLFFFAIILLRVIPHIANAVPIFAFLNVLAVEYKFPKKNLALFTVLGVCLSDLLLSYIHNYPALGSYSIFTYTGYMLVIYLFSSAKNRKGQLVTQTITATFLFWLWTNFGVWAIDGIYSLDVAGFCKCYILGLPFLQYSILANSLAILLFIFIPKLKNTFCISSSRFKAMRSPTNKY